MEISRQKASLVFIGCVLLGLSIAASYYLKSLERVESSMIAEFLNLSDKRYQGVKEKLQEKKMALKSIESFFSASAHVSSEEFEQFTEGLIEEFKLDSICWTSSDRKERYNISSDRPGAKDNCKKFNVSEPTRFLFEDQSLVMISEFASARNGQKGFASLVFDFRTLAIESDQKLVDDAIAMNAALGNLLLVYNFRDKKIEKGERKGREELIEPRYLFIESFGDAQFIYLSYLNSQNRDTSEENQILVIALLIFSIALIIGLYIRGLILKEEEVSALVEVKTQQLHRAQKMETLGQLTGGIAHDVNNKLAIMQANLDILPILISKGEPIEKSIGNIRDTIGRAADLTAQLLTFSRKRETKKSVIQLNQVVETSLKMLERVVPKNIELEFLPEASLKFIECDPHQIDQIVMNLVINARDAIDGPGKIKIRTKNVRLTKSLLPVWEVPIKPGAFCCLSVEDSGSGMSEEVRSKVFDPFFTTKDFNKGTGLGLSVVHGIITENGGFVEVKNGVEGGACFDVFFRATEKELDQN